MFFNPINVIQSVFVLPKRLDLKRIVIMKKIASLIKKKHLFFICSFSLSFLLIASEQQKEIKFLVEKPNNDLQFVIKTDSNTAIT